MKSQLGASPSNLYTIPNGAPIVDSNPYILLGTAEYFMSRHPSPCERTWMVKVPLLLASRFEKTSRTFGSYHLQLRALGFTSVGLGSQDIERFVFIGTRTEGQSAIAQQFTGTLNIPLSRVLGGFRKIRSLVAWKSLQKKFAEASSLNAFRSL